MIDLRSVTSFALIALGLVLTPGPNMLYLLGRAMTQGRWAGFISLLGIASCLFLYMLSAALGLTSFLLAAPFAFKALQWAGAAYLLYLAWNAIRPGARSPLQPREDLDSYGPRKLFAMGFLTNLFNPKAALLYLSLLPQFVQPSRGHIFLQSVTLGLTQISVSFTVNLMIVLTAGAVATLFRTRPSWLLVQRWVMASVLTGLAVHLALTQHVG